MIRHKILLQNKIKILIFISIFLIIILLRITKNTEIEIVSESRGTPVEINQITLKTYKPEYVFYGNVIGNNEIELVSDLDGKVTRVSEKLIKSKKVKKGEVLFYLDDLNFKQDLIQKETSLKELKSDLLSSYSLLEEAKRQLDIATKDHERKNKLYGNTVTKKALEDSLLVLSNAKSKFLREEFKIESLKAKIEEAKSKIKIAKNNLKKTKFKAPFSGKISNNKIDLGSEIIKGKYIASLINTNALDVKFFVGESSFTKLGNLNNIIGKNILVKWNKSNYKKKYNATISNIDSVINEKLAGLNMRASLEKIDELDPLRPGVFVEILVKGDEVRNALLVNENSIYEDKFIYVISDNKPEKIEIEIKGFIGSEIICSGNFGLHKTFIVTRLNNIQNIKKVYSVE